MRETVVRTRVGAGGRIVIPSELRASLDMEVGSEVLIQADRSGLRIRSLRQAIREAQQIVARHVKPGERLSDELIRERQQETEETARERHRS